MNMTAVTTAIREGWYYAKHEICRSFAVSLYRSIHFCSIYTEWDLGLPCKIASRLGYH